MKNQPSYEVPQKLPSREELEQRRLWLETEKLKLEVKQLARSRMSLLSILLSVASFLGGFAANHYSELDKRAEAREQERAALHAKLLDSLNATDSARRLTAVSQLRIFVGPHSPHSLWDLWDSTQDQEMLRSRDTLTALAYMIRVEPDPQVLESIAMALAAGRLDAIRQLLDSNRAIQIAFVRSSARFGCVELFDDRMEQNSEVDVDSQLPTEDLQDLVLRNVMPFEAARAASNESLPRFFASYFLESPLYKSDFGRASRECIQSLNATRKAHQKDWAFYLEQQHKSAETSVIQAARALVASSIAISEIASSPHPAQDLNLSKVALVSAPHDFHLTRVSLTDAYVAGDGDGFACSACDLSRADLRSLSLRGARIVESQLTETYFPVFDRAQFAKSFAASTDLSGSNWWCAYSGIPTESQYHKLREHIELLKFGNPGEHCAK